MFARLCLVLAVLVSQLRSRSRLEAENSALRRQQIALWRKVKGRAQLTNNDRWLFAQLYRCFGSAGLTIIQPETFVRWHWAGFRCYWRWKSPARGGRPQIESDLRALIRRMSIDNPLWGAPRIHGELLKLGFGVAQSSVARASNWELAKAQTNLTRVSEEAGTPISFFHGRGGSVSRRGAPTVGAIAAQPAGSIRGSPRAFWNMR